MKSRFLCAWATIAIALGTAAPATRAQQPAGPPPSIANEAPPDPAAEEIHAAVRKGDAAAVKALLDKGISVNAKWRYGMTPLFPACDRGYIEIAKLLIERGADLNAQDSFYGATALDTAMRKDHFDIVRLLLDKGARGKEGALRLGVTAGSVELTQIALAQTGYAPELLTSLLLRAKRANRADITEMLRKAGATEPPKVDVPAETLASYAGTYRNAQGAERVYRVNAGALEGGVPGGNNLHFYPVDQVTFRVEEIDNATLTFQMEGGRVTQVTVKQGEQANTYKRVEANP